MAQRYTDPDARVNMALGYCPECGKHPDVHSPDTRFWVPRECSLTRVGVLDRIAEEIKRRDEEA
jgi:hypothetical protein